MGMYIGEVWGAYSLNRMTSVMATEDGSGDVDGCSRRSDGSIVAAVIINNYNDCIICMIIDKCVCVCMCVCVCCCCCNRLHHVSYSLISHQNLCPPLDYNISYGALQLYEELSSGAVHSMFVDSVSPSSSPRRKIVDDN